MKDKTRLIGNLSTVLVFALAAVAFTLSFDALRALAESNGVAPNLAALFPLAVDGFILAAALASLRANLHGESALFPSLLVGVFTLTSTALNVAHSNGVLAIPRPWLATIVAAVPPVALLLAAELAFAQIRSVVKRRIAMDTLEHIRAEIADVNRMVAEAQEERQAIADEIKDLGRESRKLLQRIKDRRAELDELARGPQGAEDALLAFFADNPRATHDAAGLAVGRSRQWVGPTLAKLEAAGRIKRNGSGDGIEVVAETKGETA